MAPRGEKKDHTARIVKLRCAILLLRNLWPFQNWTFTWHKTAHRTMSHLPYLNLLVPPPRQMKAMTLPYRLGKDTSPSHHVLPLAAALLETP
jgi:hypothetical protein